MILDNPSVYGDGSPLQITLTHPDSSETTNDLTPDSTIGDQPSLTAPKSFTIDNSEQAISITVNESSVATIEPTLRETREGKSRLNPSEIKDTLFELTYTIGS